MACEAPFNAFRIATESLSQDVYVLATYKSPMLNLIPRGTFPRGQGIIRSTFTVGRSEPTTDEPTFTQVTTGDGNTYVAACSVTYNDVPVGFKEVTYGPEVFGWRGPILCEDKLMFDFNIEAFVPLYVRKIAQYTEQTIANRFTNIYISLVPKAAANADFHFHDGVLTAHPPASPDLSMLDESLCFIDQTMLDETANELIDAGATDIDTDGWIQMGGDGPLFTMLIGLQASKQLMLENAELRADLRYADMSEGNGARTIQRLGAKKTLGNFIHMPWLRPPRYYWDDQLATYVRVPSRIVATSAYEAATKGEVTTANPDWVNPAVATHEGLLILTPWVFTSEIVEPVTSAGGGVAFNPINHVGVFDFITGGKEISTTDCYDPRKKLGAHFAEFWHSPRPIYPIYGRFIIFRRCPNSYNCTNCT